MYAQLIFKIKQMTSQYVAFIHIFSQTYNLALFTNQKRVDRIQQDIRCKWRNLLSFKLRNSKQTMPISAPKSCWKVWSFKLHIGPLDESTHHEYEAPFNNDLGYKFWLWQLITAHPITMTKLHDFLYGIERDFMMASDLQICNQILFWCLLLFSAFESVSSILICLAHFLSL